MPARKRYFFTQFKAAFGAVKAHLHAVQPVFAMQFVLQIFCVAFFNGAVRRNSNRACRPPYAKLISVKFVKEVL